LQQVAEFRASAEQAQQLDSQQQASGGELQATVGELKMQVAALKSEKAAEHAVMLVERQQLQQQVLSSASAQADLGAQKLALEEKLRVETVRWHDDASALQARIHQVRFESSPHLMNVTSLLTLHPQPYPLILTF